jgi:hypothetical protein
VFWGIVAIALVYWFPVRAWYRRSGASRLGRKRVMTGDAILSAPQYEATLAITVAATPDQVWPWLLQMGRGRRLKPTAEWQHLKAGDAIEITLAPRFPIAQIEPYRTLVLSGGREGFEWSWQFELHALNGQRTRVVSRKRVSGGATLRSSIMALVLQPVSFVIARKMLLDVKMRAERAATASPAAVRAA